MNRHPLTIGLLLALTAAPAFAQFPDVTQPDETQEAGDSLETVVVTGTRTSTRTVASSPSPIDVITPQALEATGTSELATALSRALPSLNFPRPAITDAVRPIRSWCWSTASAATPPHSSTSTAVRATAPRRWI